MSVKTDASRQITEGVIWKQLLIFFFPIMLGSFFQQLYNTVDTVVVGQFVGKEALAAVGGSSAQIASLVVGFFYRSLLGGIRHYRSLFRCERQKICQQSCTQCVCAGRGRRNCPDDSRHFPDSIHAGMDEYAWGEHGGCGSLSAHLFWGSHLYLHI